ncbi:alpha/beta hydrolase [Bifidobacterium sp. BRDM6]|uniref:Alpha/beta hydrolase n=2 Tax=Bifidobacterium choloepi TaxID=2614131 RepID=A0A6I5NDA4_9BIFI|nr:alpha/beta hydrolase [Bifidobacterium choloepi]
MQFGGRYPDAPATATTATPDLTDPALMPTHLNGTVLFIHGGGWATGSPELYTDACANLALQTNRRVVSVDYRRAPDYRFPQAPEDCYEAARQLATGELRLPPVHGVEQFVVPERLVVFGDSAGGNLTAAVSLMARDRGEFAIRTQMMLYPCLNNDYDPDTTLFDSVRTNGKDYMLTAKDMADYVNMYRSSPADFMDPYFAPLNSTDLTRQPRTLMMTAEYCPLRDEGETYARELAQAGNDVECYRIRNGVHGYFLYPRATHLVTDTYAVIRHFLDGEPLGDADAAGEPSGPDESSGAIRIELDDSSATDGAHMSRGKDVRR